MNKTVLLIQPPYGEIFKIPYGTLPALTSSLRNKGYDVIQRDLNVEVFQELLETKITSEIYNFVQKRIHILDTSKAEDLLAINRLKSRLKFFKTITPVLRKICAFPAKESKKRKFKLLTHDVANSFYQKYLDTINSLITSPVYQKSYFERLDDNEHNIYYLIFEKIMKSITWEKIILVGITVSDSETTVLAGLTFASMIKKRYPHIHIAIGGHLFLLVDFDNEEDMQDLREILSKYADSIVMYEGDTAIVKIFECLIGKNSWDAVPNLIRLNNGKVNINRPFYIEKVEDLPLYDFEGLPIHYYPGLPIEINRGCYWNKCSFCRFYRMHARHQEFSCETPYYRFFDPDKTVSAIKSLQNRYNKDFFNFTGLAVSPIEMRKLCKAIIDSRIRIKFGTYVRLDKTFTPDLFDLMAKAGAYYFHINPETFSEKIAKLHNKNYDIQHIKNLITYWHKNIRCLPRLQVKVFTKFPGENFEDFLETYNFIKKNSFDLNFLGSFGCVKNSGVYFNPHKYGLTLKKVRKNDSLFNHIEVIWNEDIAKERKKISDFILKHRKEIRKMNRRWEVKEEILYETPSKFVRYGFNLLCKLLKLFLAAVKAFQFLQRIGKPYKPSNYNKKYLLIPRKF